LKNGVAYCEIVLRNRTCKQALKITRLRYLCPMLISTFSVPVRLEVVNQVYTSVELSVNAQ